MKIFIVDDHQLFREGLRLLLETVPDYDVVAEFNDVSGLHEAVVEWQPDLVILDYNIPGGGSLAALETIKKRFLAIKVITLTGVQSGKLFKQLVAAKADGIFLKDMSAKTMLASVKKVLDGKQVFSEGVRHYISVANQELTGREFQIMDFIVAGLNSKEIADKLHLTIKTVENHRYNLMQKLGLKNPVELVHYAQKHGLLSSS